MNLGLNMSLAFRLRIDCRVCGGWDDGHEFGCPIPTMEALAERRKDLGCPSCHASAVDQNTDDWWECAKCHDQFLGGLGGPIDAEKAEKLIILDIAENRAITVVKLPDKGKGRFVIDEGMKVLAAQAKKMRAETAARKSVALKPPEPEPEPPVTGEARNSLENILRLIRETRERRDRARRNNNGTE